ncbi:nucleotide sugar dehydrogenase [Sulfuriferula thiophila]|uniref:nucleotide sugar dehydrogenase n=1 Tax=Sulfuriferula thiophila TaxID=1781211 RepID=UPI000F608738|nr:nucleotide sugar dehydrogenase [Sulfuriferula thiophila]
MSTVAIVGLGYVGLPLAVAFGKIMPTIGFSHTRSKVEDFRRYVVAGSDVESSELRAAEQLTFTDDPVLLAEADFIIIAVPTPVDAAHQPDFTPLIDASRTVGQHMKRGAIVIYESTVYPGATEEICVPQLEQASGLKWQHDFHVGYSPERINPGDKRHTLSNVVKIVSGDSAATLALVAGLYASIVTVGVHRVSCIKVAEAAKVIENTQRDLNIALMNELAIIFHLVGIDSQEVLEAAGTKWNFLPFQPGLVGGHCIGVDPYYLTSKAEMLGYHPDVILAGRRINDGMGKFIADQVIKLLIKNGSPMRGVKVNVLGLTFKENIADLRNSKVMDLIRELESFGVKVFVHDPVADSVDAVHKYGLNLLAWDELPVADAMVVAVAHQQFLDKPVSDLLTKLVPNGCFIDVKCRFDATALQAEGLTVWRL